MSEIAESVQIKPGEAEGRSRQRWWSVDPGEKHVGIAMWDGDELMKGFELDPAAFLSCLKVSKPKLVVIEAFSLRSPRWTNAQARQAAETLKLIGGVEALVTDWGGQVLEQQPSVRHVAQRSPYWRTLQKENKVAANSHVRSAIAHGLYHLKFAKGR